MDFTAIDFETATRRSDSACQLAAVRVRGGEIVNQACWLIRPRPFYISPQNIQIHGITPEMVHDEPEFGELWPVISDTLADDCLIAHNASFDLGVLMACLHTHGHPIPEMQYSCTRAIARRTWPRQPRFGLKPLSDWLGVRFKHHDALEDSIACAKIALAAAEEVGATSLEQLEEKLKLTRGIAGEWGKSGPTTSRRPSRRRSTAASSAAMSSAAVSSSAMSSGAMRADQGTSGVEVLVSAGGVDLQRLFVRAEFIRPLAGQSVVFTGTLTRIAREDAEKLTICSGGRCVSSVSRRTNLLVVGEVDPRTLRSGRSQSTKEEKARGLIADGVDVRIVSEEEFLRMITDMT
ncbi:exonuclease domain-containing protein [Aporhodopirellula aestuarii]|uniref:Exonuclease domain-containing protein n=1 Tax=Aporhodopirellula aestuarii TaxID=2950107 RepID=A0ABT0U690_9BACT|nr:exonuclease domain-containing protein [Aporhodopirellula aestuarii]MCM2372463.1 exonuclease domain-containing protein [Aporhodopirellula aestuarii]